MNEKKEIKSNFEIELNNFLERINSLEKSFPIVLSTLAVSRRKAVEQYNKFVEGNLKKTVTEDGKEIFYVDEVDKIINFNEVQKNLNITRAAYEIISNNFLVSLVSQFDAFIGGIIRTIYICKPEILNSSEKNLTFSQLSKFENISDAREFIIEKEVESVLRNSHSDHIKWLSNKIEAPLTKDLYIWSHFIELTERRNLFVHCDGKISNQYIQVCKENGYNFSEIPIVGKKLNINKLYFKNSYKCLFEFATKLVHVVWRKLIPDELFESEFNLNNIAFDLILKDENDLAIEILKFATETIKKHSDEKLKLYMIINKAQAFKWKGDKEICLEILATIDWKAKCEVLQLANFVLNDDFDNSLILMERIGNNSIDINKSSYKDWPLFRELRKDKRFIDLYEKLFNEKYEIVQKKDIIY